MSTASPDSDHSAATLHSGSLGLGHGAQIDPSTVMALVARIDALEKQVRSSDGQKTPPSYADRCSTAEKADTDACMTLEPVLCGKELPADTAAQKAQLQIMYLEIISCNSIETGPFMNWYFTARQSMATRGLERVYLYDDRSDPANYLEARKHSYALVHSVDPALRHQLWPSVPLLQLSPHIFFKHMKEPTHSITRALSVRVPATLAFQTLERGREEPMNHLLQRAVSLYFTMAYLPLEMWFQMPLAMLANQVMLSHRKHYTFGCFMTQQQVDNEIIKWTSGHELPAMLSFFSQRSPMFSVSG